MLKNGFSDDRVHLRNHTDRSGRPNTLQISLFLLDSHLFLLFSNSQICQYQKFLTVWMKSLNNSCNKKKGPFWPCGEVDCPVEECQAIRNSFQGFNRHWQKKKHMQCVHLYHCPCCGEKSLREYNIRRHLRIKQGMTTTQDLAIFTTLNKNFLDPKDTLPN